VAARPADSPGVETRRCRWCIGYDDYQRYHDEEWGQPVGDDRRLFEKLCLEGFQSGLSWLTILRKRENFRRAFADFDYDRIARWNARSVERLLRDEGIVRHRAKIEATLANARCARILRDEFGSLGAFFWRFEPDSGERPRRVDERSLAALTETKASRAMAGELKQRGFRFVGPTTAYAFMQSMGIVNDHVEDCDFREAVEAQRSRFPRPVPPPG
jgi:DNA-3-methyladenine glycosylase I